MAAREREQLRTADATLHLLGQREWRGLVVLAMHDDRGRLYFRQPGGAVDRGGCVALAQHQAKCSVLQPVCAAQSSAPAMMMSQTGSLTS